MDSAHDDLAEVAAGVHSVKQSVSQEPSFTHKRWLCGQSSESQIARERVLIQSEEAGSRAKTQPQKAVQHGAQPAPLSTEYQIQFTWKTGSQSEAPLLSAEKLMMNRSRRQEERGSTDANKRSRGEERGSTDANKRSREEGRGSTDVERLVSRPQREGKGNGGAEKLVNGFKLPGEERESGGSPEKLGTGGEKREEERVEGKGRGGRPRGGRKEGLGKKQHKRKSESERSTEQVKRAAPLANRNHSPRRESEKINKHQGDGTSHSVVPRRSKSPSKSPRPRPTGRPSGTRGRSGKHGRSSRKIRSLFPGQSEYRTQFKAWPIPSNTGGHGGLLYGQRKRQKIRTPRKRSDITDPRLTSPSSPLPPPPPPPPDLQSWGTEYSTRFKSPLDSQYVRGAWTETPHPSPTPQAGRRPGGDETCRESNPHPLGVEEERKEGDDDNEQPIPPEESLLAQLSEIRRKALEYRQRSEECHFASLHPSWRSHERESTPNNAHSQAPLPISRSSSVSSLSDDEPTNQNTARPHTVHNGHPSHRHPSHSSHTHPSHPHTLTNGRMKVEDMEDEEKGEREGGSGDESDESVTEDTSNDEEERETRTLPSKRQVDCLRVKWEGSRAPLDTAAPLKEGSRVPTPILRQSPVDVRHHLDRTTPSSGGAVLTSPTIAPGTSKSSQNNITNTAHRGREGGRGERQKSQAVHTVSSSLATGGKKGSEGGNVEGGGRSLHLSHGGGGGGGGSAKLKRDPTLLSSVSGMKTLPSRQLSKSSVSQTRNKSASSQPPRGSTLPSRTQSHTLTSPPLRRRLPSPPPSTISSLLSSGPPSSFTDVSTGLNRPSKTVARGLNVPPTGVSRGLNYGSRGLNHGSSGRQTNPGVSLKLSKSRNFPRSHDGGCTGSSTKCDICGSWLRQSLTGSAQAGQHDAAHSIPRSCQYNGAVTQLSQVNQDKSNHSENILRQGSKSNIRQGNQSSRGAEYLGPPRTLTQAPPPLRSVDELSISSLSLSSCSVASDLLRKARERREKFWTQPPNHAH